MIKLKHLLPENSHESSKWESYFETMRQASTDYDFAKPKLWMHLKNLNFSPSFIRKAVNYAKSRALNGLSESEYNQMINLRDKAMGDEINYKESEQLSQLHDRFFRPKQKDVFSRPHEDDIDEFPDIDSN